MLHKLSLPQISLHNCLLLIAHRFKYISFLSQLAVGYYLVVRNVLVLFACSGLYSSIPLLERNWSLNLYFQNENNIFRNMTTDQYKRIREGIIRYGQLTSTKHSFPIDTSLFFILVQERRGNSIQFDLYTTTPFLSPLCI